MKKSKKKLPTYEEWKNKGDEGHPPDVHLSRQIINPRWKEDALLNRQVGIYHRECGKRIESTSKEGFCPHCGEWIFLHVESRGRKYKTPRFHYATKTRACYCPHCRKTTSFKFLSFTDITGKGLKGLAWQCQCHTIYIHTEDPGVEGDITLVGPKWSISDLTPWRT